MQRGHGLGDMFCSLFRTVTADVNVLADMSENNTFIKDALKKQAKN